MVSPVSVIIPTRNRPEMVRSCLLKIDALVVAPAEVIVCDQSSDFRTSEVVAEFQSSHFRHVVVTGEGAARNRNVGARVAEQEFLMFVDDDCEVAPLWLEAGLAALREFPGSCVGGQVASADEVTVAPSLETQSLPQTWSGKGWYNRLRSGNMGVRQDDFIQIGGFDDRYARAAEDLDLGYRWLRSGRSIRYEPQMLVNHRGWRSQTELEKVYKIYAEDFGAFVGRHVAEGDWWLAREAVSVLKRSAKELMSSDRNEHSVAEARPMMTHAPRGFLSAVFETLRSKGADK